MTTSKPPAAREFWLEVGQVFPGAHIAATSNEAFKNAPSIHVIEKSAYDAVVKERDASLGKAQLFEQRLDALFAERDALKADIAEMNFSIEAKYKPTGTQILDLTQERDQLKAQVTELRALLDNSQLKKDNVALDRYCHQLKEENARLRADRNIINEEWEELRELLGKKLARAVKGIEESRFWFWDEDDRLSAYESANEALKEIEGMK